MLIGIELTRSEPYRATLGGSLVKMGFAQDNRISCFVGHIDIKKINCNFSLNG